MFNFSLPRFRAIALSPSVPSQSFAATSLLRTLTPFEALGFSLGGLLLWLGTAPSMHAAIGPQALLVWLVGTVAGVMLNLQVRHLGQIYPDVVGGTPNYTTRLLHAYPKLAQYSAIGYWLGWVSIPPMNAIILTDLIQSNLDTLHIHIPTRLFQILLTSLPYVLAFSGTRALGILHSFFVLPAVGLLLLFCLSGVAWLTLSPQSPGLIPAAGTAFSLSEWMKWYFMAVYAVYGGETGSSFVADSQRPRTTLNFITLAAILLPIVYLGGSCILTTLSSSAADPSTFLLLASAAQPFWGNAAPLVVTLLIGSGVLLCSATAVSNSPRILYQMARDRHLAPVFGVVSQRGVFGPGLCLTLLLSWVCLLWGNVDRVVMITGTGYLCAMMAFHWGMWLQRRRPESLWAHGSLGFLLLEAVALVVGGIAWSWQDLLLGLSLPLGIACLNWGIQRCNFAPFHPHWWVQFHQSKSLMSQTDFLMTQVISLLIIICITTGIGWWVRAILDLSAPSAQSPLLALVILIAAFVGVAIACWTSLPQVLAVHEGREVAEQIQQDLSLKTQQLEAALRDLQNAQLQVTQSEKMSALGNLVAGVAHEINNPVGCIVGNVSAAQDYVQDLLEIIDLYQQKFPHADAELAEALESIDLDYVREDLPKLIKAMQDGGDRIKALSRSLRTFSRADTDTQQNFNLHEGIESTLLILRHRLKANDHRPAIEVTTDYGDLPEIRCFPGQLNQVFMNLLANAIDALEEVCQTRSFAEIKANPQRITIRTRLVDRQVRITIADNGTGIPDAIKDHIFDHLFTTKAVGQGTGLGLAIAQQIIVEKHGGAIEVQSQIGQGCEFILTLPLS